MIKSLITFSFYMVSCNCYFNTYDMTTTRKRVKIKRQLNQQNIDFSEEMAEGIYFSEETAEGIVFLEVKL